MLRFFQQSYPYYYSGKKLFYLMGLICCMGLIFNYFFEPFIVYRPEHKVDYFWISAIHSVNPAWIGLAWGALWNWRADQEKWTVGKELLVVGGYFLCVGISQFLIRDLIYDNPDNWTWKYLLEEIRNTFLVGTLFVLILVPINFVRLQHKHEKQAANIKLPTITSYGLKEDCPMSFVQTQQKSDDFELDLGQFLMAKAAGNYVEIFLEKGENVEKLIKRMPLKGLENQLGHLPFLLKTHRSHLVNLRKVKEVKGNAQGLQLTLSTKLGCVPVSRGMLAQFEKNFTKD